MPILIPSHKIAYFDIPKAASSSVKAALYRLERGEDFTSKAAVETAIHWVYPTSRLDPARDFDAARDFWKCTVVRDPVARLLSAYSNRVVYHRDQLRGRFARSRAFFLGVPLDPDPNTFFTRLGRYRLQSGQLRHHINLASLYIGTDLSRFDAVYPIERLNDLAAELSHRAGTRVTFPRLQTGGPKIVPEMLSPRAWAAVVDYLAPDYALLAEYYRPPELSQLKKRGS